MKREQSLPNTVSRIAIYVINHTKSLQDPHPLRDIFGTSDSDSDADVIFDYIEAEVDEDIEHAGNSV